FSAAAAGIDVSLTTHGRRYLPLAKKLSELNDPRSRHGRRHPRCSQADGDYEWPGLDFSNAAFCPAEASFWYFLRHSSYGMPYTISRLWSLLMARPFSSAASFIQFDRQLRQKPARFIMSMFCTSVRLRRCSTRRRYTAASSSVRVLSSMTGSYGETQDRHNAHCFEDLPRAPTSS